MAPSTSDAASSEVLALLESLRPGNRHAFLQPSASIPTDSLKLVKDTLESFAAQVSDEQQRRIQESRKRKRKGQDDGLREEALKVRKVYIDGFETNQVWQQAKKIIHGVLSHSQNALDEMEDRMEAVVANGYAQNGDVSDEDDDDDLVLGSDEELVPEDEDDYDEEDLSDAELLDGEELEEDDEEALENGLDDDHEDEDEEEDDEEETSGQEFVEDPHGLNDGFFSIDDFNKQTQWFEDQDAKGDPNTDLASDDEEIDWTADPMAPQKKSANSKKSRDQSDDEDDGLDAEEDEEDDDEDGPTFGNMDLDAPEGDSEEEDFDAAPEDPEDEGGANANEVYYKDFFAPPQKKSTGKPKKAVHFKPKAPAEGDVERAMEDVKRDLFDDSDDAVSDDDLSDVSAGDPKSRRSAHERRQAKLADEIRKLEAASIAKREWTLSGEAAAPDRPMNSLLEQDLDFEHGGKPVPVITPEITEDMEAMIKRRILAQEFDEVLRRRPDADVPQNTRRGLVAVDDKKSDRGLADLYEEQHVKDSNPDTYVSASDEQLRKEEQEVETLWKNVVSQLDALSSWHYKPKPAAPAISVVSDVATVAMEDAQPATSQGVAASDSRLAPQEIYSATNKNKEKGEVVTKGGAPLAREELSREDKARMRRREKERVRKAGGRDAAMGKKPLQGRAKERDETMKDLKKGGVMVINRKGEVTDVQGNKPKAVKAVASGSYKL